jgi:ABC-2 type transport system permease protein
MVSHRATEGPSRALALRAFADARIRTISFACLFALYAYVQAVGYRSGYPTLVDRVAFARAFAGNDALRLFYGFPYDPLTVSGYVAWRVGGTLAIAAAVFGVLAAVRALRTEEDAGRTELILAAPLGRGSAYLSAMLAVGSGTLVLWLAELLGFVAGGLPVGGSAYMALATVSVVPVFVGVGALAGQLAPTRRMALELGSTAVGLALLLRVVADTSSAASRLRWGTPLGWAEELRPFTSPRPAVLLLPLIATVLLLSLAARIALGRDIGTGLLTGREDSEPHLRLLSSPIAQALREERGSLLVWLGSIGVFAAILGMVSTSISSGAISASMRAEIAKLGSGSVSISTPSGYLSFAFIFFVLAISLFMCAQLGAAGREESEGRLETLLAQPVARLRWLGGRLLLASAGAAVIALTAGLFTWAGAVSQGVSIALPKMIEAGANCLPVALLFLGLAALAHALAPRAGSGISYGLVTVAFIWELVGSLLRAPSWLVKVTPFEHVGLVPQQSFRTVSALIMLAIALTAALAAAWVFRRRDVVGL